MRATTEQDVNIELLHDIHTVFEEVGVCFIASTELVKKLEALDSRPWADWKNGKPITPRAVADRLKAFGIVPKPNERATARGYDRDRFADAWTRFPPSKPSNRQTANENGPEPAILNRQASAEADTSKLQETPLRIARHVRRWADSGP